MNCKQKYFIGVLLIAFSINIYSLPKIAVINIDISKNIDSSVVIPLTDIIISELIKYNKYSVLERENINKILEEKELQYNFSNGNVKEIDKILGADYYLISRLEKIDSIYYFSSKILDVVSSNIINQIAIQCPDNQKNLFEMPKEIVFKLLNGNISLGTNSITNSKKNDIKIVNSNLYEYYISLSFKDIESNYIFPEQVYVLDQETKTVKSADSLEGNRLIFKFKKMKKITILCADPKYVGIILKDIDINKEITINYFEKDGGSVIADRGTCYIPGLDGRLNPIKDSLNRTYIYADNISIDNGKQQPVPFAITTKHKLIDSNDEEYLINIPFIEGSVSLINYYKK